MMPVVLVIAISSLSTVPTAYDNVLKLLRRAVASGKWSFAPPPSRARVMHGCGTGESRSLTLINPAILGDVKRLPRANYLFPELAEAVFDLERRIVPTEEAGSTRALVEFAASTLPHVIPGPAGPRGTLVVSLGEYSDGGNLFVAGEAEPIDVLYQPHRFDGYSQLHWSSRFAGEWKAAALVLIVPAR